MIDEDIEQNIVDFLNFPKVTGRCGYYSDRACTEEYCFANWLKRDLGEAIPVTRLYSDFKQRGFCRFNSQFYIHKCYGCEECKAIRIPVSKFEPSKSQKAAWKKNQDLEVTLVTESKDFVTEEKAFMLREYDYFHNKANGEKPKSMDESTNLLTQMNSGYDGIWNMEYRMNGKLIGVAILDFTTDSNGRINSLCSNYFYYDVRDEVRKRSIGVFSVLKEIELCTQMKIPYYYLGLYLHGCKKMNYKANYKPFELFVDNSWVDGEIYIKNNGGALRGHVEASDAPLEGVATNHVGARGRPRKDFSENLFFEKSFLSPPKYIDLPAGGSYSPEYADICFITEDIELDFLYSAYRQGIFPWFNESEGEPVVWQSPDPRFVIFPEKFHVSKSTEKFLRKSPYTYTKDKAFEQVMKNCEIQKREGQNGSWIGPKMLAAYKKIHEAGYAHSYEVWLDERLVGGFYGIDLGSVFCGESMFTIEPDSSKSAFVLFARKFFAEGGKLIDCQAYTDNMARYGAVEIPREEYIKMLEDLGIKKVQN